LQFFSSFGLFDFVPSSRLDTSSLWLFDLPPDAVSTFSDLGRYVYVGAAYWGLAAFVIKQVGEILFILVLVGK
jgi:hypothetical protein